MKRNLTILASRFYPDRHGGVETRLNAFARAAAAMGVQTEVWSENRSNSAASEQLADNLTVRRQTRQNLGRLSLLQPLANVLWWRKRLRADPPGGWIWATDPAMATAVLLAGLKTKLVYNPAGCCAAMREIGRRYPAVKSMQLSKLWEPLDGLAYQQAAKVFVGSRNVADQFNHCYAKGNARAIHVVPFGVTPPSHSISRAEARNRLGIEQDEFIIGFVGRIDPCKQIDFALEAVANADLPRETRVLIVGTGADEMRIKSRAKELSLSEKLIWAGNLENPSHAYAAMNVFVLPSVYEAFGQVLLEAMAHGVPVIGRRGDGKSVMTASAEIIDDGRTGFVVDGHDPSDMGVRLAELAHDEIKRTTMSAAARDHAATQTWANYAGKCLNYLYLDFHREREVDNAHHRQTA